MSKQTRGRTHTAWWKFIQSALDERSWSGADFERASGIDRSRLVSWRDKGARPSIDNARVVARTFGVPLLEVLVVAEVLTEDEARTTAASPADPVRSAPTGALLREIERRLAGGQPGTITREDIDASGGRLEDVDDEVAHEVAKSARPGTECL